MNPVVFHHADKRLHIKDQAALKRFLVTLFKKEKVSLNALHYIFCSDDYLLEINRSFLQHDYYTDIISFDLAEKGMPVEGEIYISLDRVKENAKSLGCTYREELLRVVFHGALHLCGYKDKKKSEILEMRNKEASYLRLFTK